MGFDDIEFACIAYTALTNIRQPLQEMGATAAELLIRKFAKSPAAKKAHDDPKETATQVK